MKYNYIDLFSGIGGFALGAKWAGWQWNKHYFSEINEFAINQYNRNFPAAINLGDIKKIDTKELKTDGKSTWIVSGGFPCQPFSTAGQRRGSEDDRYLWPYVLQFINDLKPDWILLENVIGIISMGLDKMLSDLERVGYTNREGESIIDPIIVPACALNAPHKRDRVFIIAYSTAKRWATQLYSNNVLQRSQGQPANWVDTPGNPFLQFEKRFCEPPVFAMDDGLPGWLDKNYKLGLECVGESVVPELAQYFFQIIKIMEGQNDS